jgi:hypothetical protein
VKRARGNSLRPRQTLPMSTVEKTTINRQVFFNSSPDVVRGLPEGQSPRGVLRESEVERPDECHFPL